MSLKVSKNTVTQDYQKDGTGWPLFGLQQSTYDTLLPVYGAYSDNRSITEVNLIKLGINKEVLSIEGLETSLFSWSNGQYITNESEVLELSKCIYKVEFKNGFDIYETEPFLVYNETDTPPEPPVIIGELFRDDFDRMTLGANWTKIGSPITSLDGSGVMTFSGGALNFNNYIKYTPYLFNLGRYTLHMELIASSDPGTIVIGIEGQNTFYATDKQFQFFLSDGRIYYYTDKSLPTGQLISITTITISEGDSVHITVERRANEVVCTLVNITTGQQTTATVTFGFTYPNSDINTADANLLVFAINGFQLINNVYLTSDYTTPKDIEWIVDSIGEGLNAGIFTNRFVDLLGGDFLTIGGPGERILEFVNMISEGNEFSKYTSTKTFIFAGTNDTTEATPFSQLEGNYNTLYAHLISLGRDIWHVSALPRNTFGGNINAFNTYLSTTYTTRYIDINTEFNDGADGLKAIYDCGDGVHPNQAGHAKIAELLTPYI